MESRSVTFTLLASACLASLFACTASPPSDSGSDPNVRALLDGDAESVVAELERSIPELMKRGHVPGLSIAVVRDGETIWRRGFGVKNRDTGETVTDETIFEAASLTKPLVGYAILRLVDEGVLELDQPLVEVVPEAAIEDKLLGHALDLSGFRADWLSRITTRHVLSHASGMPHGERGEPYPMLFEPGSRYKYSAAGYYFAQLAVEELTGKSLEAIARAYVFEPLGMEHSSLIWQDRYETTLANGHDRFGSPQGLRRYEEPHAAASLYTTAADYARFVGAVLNGTGLRPETAAEMLTPQIEVAEKDHWSLGFGLQQDENGSAFWQWGDWGVFRNFIIAYKEQGSAVVYLTNSFNGLSICEAIVGKAVGGNVYSMGWLGYERYDSPTFELAWLAFEEGASRAIQRLDELRTSNPGVANEQYVNRLGYELLAAERYDDAIGLLRQNVKERPDSANTYDSLAEAYATRGGAGDVELAIEYYKKALETIPRDSAADPSSLQSLKRNAEARIAELEKPGG